MTFKTRLLAVAAVGVALALPMSASAHRGWMVPAFTNRGIELGKMTAIASIIAVHELMYEARLLSASSFRPLEVFTVIAIIYFVVIYPIAGSTEKPLSRYFKALSD